MLRVNQAQQAGKLDAYIEDHFQKFSQAKAAEQTTPTRELVSLIGLLRVKRDFKRAETVIGWLPDVDMQRQIRNELVLQQGDWQEILRRAKLGPDEPNYISINLLQEALLHHLVGDQVAVEEVKQKLRQQLKTATEGNEAEGGAMPVSLLRSQLRFIGAITLDWPLMVEFLEPDNLGENFDFLVMHNRSDEAMKLLKIEPTFKARRAWMEATLKEIADATEKMNKRTNGRVNPNFQEQQKLVREKTRLVNAVAEITEQRGLDDETQLYYQMIYSADTTPQGSRRTEVLDRLVGLGRTDDYWQLVSSILSDPTHVKFMSRYWFGIQDSTVKSLANQWASRIRGAIEDPLDQAKTVAAIMNSPWLNREEMDFDLDFEIARFRTRSTLNSTGLDEFMLAQVFELNGRDEASAEMLQQAATLGYSSAIVRSYKEALATDDARGILKYWKGAYNRATETCLLAEQAALKLLKTETDPARIKNIEQQLRICRLAKAAKWIGGSTWDRGGFSQLQDVDESHLAIFRLQCMAYGVSGDFGNRSREQGQLGDALATEEADQAYQGSIESASVMFNQLAFANGASGARSDMSISYAAMQLNLAIASGMIERAEYDKAVDLLVRESQFSPGDGSVGETTIKKLDQLGETKAADQVYQAIQKYFVQELEAYPDSPIARNNYAWLMATSKRDLEMARRHANVAIKVRPNVKNYLDTLAEVEFLLGNPKVAFELSKRCVQLSPEEIITASKKSVSVKQCRPSPSPSRTEFIPLQRHKQSQRQKLIYSATNYYVATN